MRWLTLVFLYVAVLGCVSPRGDLNPDNGFPCPAVKWDNGEAVSPEDAVMASAAVDLLSGSDLVSTACGDENVSCRAVSSYVRKLGGKIVREETCAVVWAPEDRTTLSKRPYPLLSLTE